LFNTTEIPYILAMDEGCTGKARVKLLNNDSPLIALLSQEI
jgi:hypothetical protein